MSENLKPYLRRVARAAISDADVRRDPAHAFHVALAAARAAYLARTAPVDTLPEGQDGEAGLVRSKGSAVLSESEAGAQPSSGDVE